jgi:pyruvate formate lyase activating enzyme
MNAMITHIQRMSVHDGDGIRTTIFFKGCNLRCKWCHNPETFSSEKEGEWIKSKCIHCRECVKQCPADALSIVKDEIIRDKNLCEKCYTCVELCYPGAHQIIGKSITTAELCEQIAEDKSIFEQTGGGITLSGGEPMLQFPCVKELAGALSEQGYNIVLQTNLSVRWKLYKEIIPHINHFMCDLKLLDSEAHQHWTGQDNRLILENMLKLEASGVSYCLRTPVIPGVNDNEEQLATMSAFAKKMKHIKSYELLAFHPLASYKYKQLEMDYMFENAQPVQPDKFAKMREKFEFYNK